MYIDVNKWVIYWLVKEFAIMFALNTLRQMRWKGLHSVNFETAFYIVKQTTMVNAKLCIFLDHLI